jgi:hypothetical protein
MSSYMAKYDSLLLLLEWSYTFDSEFDFKYECAIYVCVQNDWFELFKFVNDLEMCFWSFEYLKLLIF